MLGNGNFILLYSKVPKYPARSGTPPYNQRATIWSLELGNIRGIWKKLIESEKFFTKYEKSTSNTGKWVINSTKLKGVERPHPQWGIPITIKNRQIGPHNWKTVKNYENNQDYTTRAAAYHFQYNLKQVSIPVPKNAAPKSSNDKLPLHLCKTHKQYLYLPNSLWVFGFYEKLKVHYSLHPNSQILWQSVTKSIETDYIFMKVMSCLKISRILPSPSSMLCQVWKSYVWQWWPGMT